MNTEKIPATKKTQVDKEKYPNGVPTEDEIKTHLTKS